METCVKIPYKNSVHDVHPWIIFVCGTIISTDLIHIYFCTKETLWTCFPSIKVMINHYVTYMYAIFLKFALQSTLKSTNKD